MTDYRPTRCAIHVHSRFSDGELPIEQVIKEAQNAGVDALLLTDHDHAYAREAGWAGYHDKLLLIIGTEYASKSNDHLITFDVHDRVNTQRHPGPQAAELLKKLGGTIYVAHPQGRPLFYFLPRLFRWKHWESTTYDGIEAWSYLHDWIERIRPWTMPGMAANPQAHITGPDPMVMRGWDDIATQRRIPGFAGLDTHGDSYRGFAKLTLPGARTGILSYHNNFTSFSHYALVPAPTGDPKQDTKSILTALREARGWMCHDAVHDGRAFAFTATHGQTCYPVGSEFEFSSGIMLEARTPIEAEIRLLSRGVVMASQHGETLRYTPEQPGEYRVEVDYEGRAWLRSNHIYLRAEAQS